MSNMFTTCPNCKLHLAVTAVDLRVGQGYVRCGRCDKVFNALLSLNEDVDRDKQSGVTATGTTTVPALEEGAQVDAVLSAPEPIQLPGPTPDPTPEPSPEPEPEPTPEALLEPEPRLEPEPARPTPDPEPEEWARFTAIRPSQMADVDVVETMATGTFETIVLEGDGFLQTEEHVDEEEVDQQIQQFTEQMDADELAGARARLADEPDVEVQELSGEEVIL
ncbi:MAG TPA: MJ0042-type zinc finger domain-containing protein, partial [Steroidobacteraceae bacterium]|nr:MJ0042-type zinc finger domain-containing protein [Steroidobacteraceae bacterium]